jgi:hypothetical protein
MKRIEEEALGGILGNGSKSGIRTVGNCPPYYSSQFYIPANHYYHYIDQASREERGESKEGQANREANSLTCL